ncbi:MAG: hypothetical protein JW945_02985 [Methanomicrobia archaeon]|nr:hypothetical protein [Methanomicrobia archaeon]
MEESEKEIGVLRLQKKLKHWVVHNSEHAASFRKAAREADALGLAAVSIRLNEAAKRMDELSEILAAAEDALR